MDYFLFFVVGLVLIVFFGIWWFAPGHIAHNFTGYYHLFDYLFFVLLTYIVWHEIIMELFCWYLANYIRHPEECQTPQRGLRVAYSTAFVPGAEPYDILEKTLAAMTAVAYPHDTWILDEGNDPVVQALCTRYGANHYSRKNRIEYNTTAGQYTIKTKGGNYNSWFKEHGHTYDIIAQHDVDFIPNKDFLLRTLGYFRDPTVAFVGGPQVYGNTTHSWIARGAAEQTYGFYGSMQKGFYGHDMALLIGANHLIRTKAFIDVGGYTAHIAEDMFTGMKFYARRWKSVYVPETLLIGEGPSTWAAYFGQQMRWSYGCMDIVLRHALKLLSKMSFRHFTNYAVLQQFYFLGIAQATGIFLLTLYFVFGITPANMTLVPILLLYLPLILYQVFFNTWLQRFNIDPTKEKGLFIRGKLLFIAAWPIYFLAFIGVITNKRLVYLVTPKGIIKQIPDATKLFVPHLIFGSITLFDIIVGFFTKHTAGQMIFWAVLNTAFMYGFFFTEMGNKMVGLFTQWRSRRAPQLAPDLVGRPEVETHTYESEKST